MGDSPAPASPLTDGCRRRRAIGWQRFVASMQPYAAGDRRAGPSPRRRGRLRSAPPQVASQLLRTAVTPRAALSECGARAKEGCNEAAHFVPFDANHPPTDTPPFSAPRIDPCAVLRCRARGRIDVHRAAKRAGHGHHRRHHCRREQLRRRLLAARGRHRGQPGQRRRRLPGRQRRGHHPAAGGYLRADAAPAAVRERVADRRSRHRLGPDDRRARVRPTPRSTATAPIGFSISSAAPCTSRA